MQDDTVVHFASGFDLKLISSKEKRFDLVRKLFRLFREGTKNHLP